MTQPEQPETLEAQVAALTRRVAELEAALAKSEEERGVYEHIVTHAPALISRLTPDGKVIAMNHMCETFSGYTIDEVRGKVFLTVLYPGELMRPVEEYMRLAMSGADVSDYELTMCGRDGTLRTLAWNSLQRCRPDGTLDEVISFGIDITERKRNEEAQRRLQDEIIAIQAATLAELSTPLIPISAEIVAMPLIGAIDESRAQRIMETLLTGIVESRATTAILDITGVAVVDSGVADGLLQAARAARLLGARVILTGIRPEVAQTLVSLDRDFAGIVTCGTLQAGIAVALSGVADRPK